MGILGRSKGRGGSPSAINGLGFNSGSRGIALKGLKKGKKFSL